MAPDSRRDLCCGRERVRYPAAGVGTAIIRVITPLVGASGKRASVLSDRRERGRDAVNSLEDEFLAVFRRQGCDHTASVTWSVQTLKPVSVLGPNVVLMATSAAS